jgi:hypothetical protein
MPMVGPLDSLLVTARMHKANQCKLLLEILLRVHAIKKTLES